MDLLVRKKGLRAGFQQASGPRLTCRETEGGELGYPTGEAPCGAHVFEGFFGLENGPVKSDKSQEKTLFGKEMPEDASRHPKPTSYPQTRQDTVVGVFPMESSN